MNARFHPALTVPLIVVGFFLAVPRPATAATPAEVEAAIKKGKQFLYALQRPEGRWEPDAQRQGNTHHEHAKMQGQSWGGYTACAVYALLAAGESPQEPRVAKGIEFLKRADITGVYAIGVRSQVWLHLPPSAETRRLAKRDADYLINQLNVAGPGRGGWDYDDLTNQAKRPTGGRIDHSVSQYGVLSLWASARAGYEINPSVWTLIDSTWRQHQYEDGGWSYAGDGKTIGTDQQPTASMTAAGVATLFITQDFLRANDGVNCRGNVTNENIEKGLRWMAAHFDEVRNNNYAWYGVERIGVASGYKYFGSTDWYAAGADEMVKRQKEDGSWHSNFPGNTPIPDTAFAMLFLSRGRAPVVMNKLDYSPVGPQDAGEPGKAPRKPREINWNQRPRDAANLTGWVATQTERDLNWQIVNLSASAEDLHDAPILYVAGSEGLDLAPQDVQKLRAFVEQGGLILGNADCGKEIFNRAFRRIGGEMFPRYEFRELPADHPIYTEQQYQASRWRNKPKVQGLSNGVRELMILLPDADAGRHWQVRADRAREELFQLGANIFLYAIDKQNLRYKGDTYVVRDKGGPTDKSLKVVRLLAGDNPDPEPGGWRRLATVLKNDHKVALTVEPAAPGAGKLAAAGAKVIHVTGTGGFKLDDASRKELVEFVKGGGTLILDAAGGSTPFADAAETELAAMFGEEWTKAFTRPLPPDHPVYSIPGAKVEQFRYRRYARKVVGELRGSRVRGVKVGDRIGVFYSREDLSGGLVGQPVDGIVGYDVATATPIMRNVLLYAMVDGNVAKLAPAPEKKPELKGEEKKVEPPAKPVEPAPF